MEWYIYFFLTLLFIDPKWFWNSPDYFRPVQISLDISKLVPLFPNCFSTKQFGYVCNNLDSSKTIWKVPKQFQLVQIFFGAIESQGITKPNQIGWFLLIVNTLDSHVRSFRLVVVCSMYSSAFMPLCPYLTTFNSCYSNHKELKDL